MTRHQLKELIADARMVYAKADQDHIFIYAASMAYTTVLSLIPLMALAYFFFDKFGGLEKLQGQMQSFIVANLAPAFGDTMMGYIEQVRSRISSGAIGIFGLLGFIYTSFSMLFKIEHTFNYIWRVKQTRPMTRRITNHWTIITLGPILVVASLAISTILLTWLKNDNGEISKLLVFIFSVIPYLMMAFLFTSLYILLPATKVHRHAAVVAGLISGLAFEIAKQGYAFYATQTLGRSVYGSLAVFPVFLVWIQVVWVLILYGAEICYHLGEKWSPETAAVRVQLDREDGRLDV